MRKVKKIYIIGNIPKKINSNCIKSFSDTSVGLSKLGYTVVNPIDKILLSRSFKEARIKNFENLINSSSVYIMPNTDLKSGIPSLEIKLALILNLVIVSSVFKLEKHDDKAINFLLSS